MKKNISITLNMTDIGRHGTPNSDNVEVNSAISLEESSTDPYTKPVIWVYSTDPSVITGNDAGGYPLDQVALMKQHFHPVSHQMVTESASLAQQVTGAIVCVPHGAMFHKQLKIMPNLKAVSVYGKGVDFIQMEQLTKRGIQVMVDVGVSADSVADFALTFILSSAWNLVCGKNDPNKS